MSPHHQGFGFEESRYERPNQRWACGRAGRGAPPCPLGPGPRGRCRADAECQPLRRGDRWHCSRPASAGGPCADGPWPDGRCGRPLARCQPALSWRGRRGRFAFWITALTGGLLAVTVLSPGGAHRLAPGPLSPVHAAIVKCEACHAAPGQDGPTQSERCLDCHRDLGPQPLRPHGEAPEELAAATERRRAASGAGPAPPVMLRLAGLGRLAPAPYAELACAACHLEHGRALPASPGAEDARCQVCHVQQFEAFGAGHPAFGSYPHGRRGPIVFDHAGHAARFGEDPGVAALLATRADPPRLDCASCHRETAERGMRAGGFHESCAGCHHHGDQIRGAGGAGFPALRLPAVDLDTLENHGLSIGAWPDDARGPDFDTPLTPLTALLLSADSRIADDLARFAEWEADGVFLFDLYGADSEQAQAAARIARAVKELLAELAAGAEPVLARRLQQALGIGPVDAAALAGRDPADLARAAAQELEHNLSFLQEDAAIESSQLQHAWAEAGGWSVAPREVGVLYRPTGHADRWLSAWLDLTGRTYSRSDPARAVFDELSHPVRGPGRCTKCHAVEEAEDGSRFVRWDAGPFSSTRFTHRPHLLGTGGDCGGCHRQVAEPVAALAEAYYDSQALRTDPTVTHANFEPIGESRCAECHRPGGAPARCSTCHLYHAGP